ncbi:hypothetical protein KUCAC02_037742 [Chaenocephalus aceratus]|nr:hypothetical protein KUCAC02_037742 [Chaenocephalus aceratus]
MPGSAKNKNNVDLKIKKSKEAILKAIDEGNAKAIETQGLLIQTDANFKALQEFTESKESDQDRLKILFAAPENLFNILLKVRESAGESVKTSSQLLKLATKAKGIKECISQSKILLKQSKSLLSKAQQAEKLFAVFGTTFQKTYGYIDTVQLFPAESDSQKNALNLSLTQQDPGPDSNSSDVKANKVKTNKVKAKKVKAKKVAISNKDILYELTTSSLPITNVTKSGNLLIKTLDTLIAYSKDVAELPLINILSKTLPPIPDPKDKDKDAKDLTDSKDKDAKDLDDSKVKNKDAKDLDDSKVKNKDAKDLDDSKVKNKDAKDLTDSKDKDAKGLDDSKVKNKDAKDLDDSKDKDKDAKAIADSQVKKKKLAEIADSQVEVADSLELSDPGVDSKDSSEDSEELSETSENVSNL